MAQTRRARLAFVYDLMVLYRHCVVPLMRLMGLIFDAQVAQDLGSWWLRKGSFGPHQGKRHLFQPIRWASGTVELYYCATPLVYVHGNYDHTDRANFRPVLESAAKRRTQLNCLHAINRHAVPCGTRSVLETKVNRSLMQAITSRVSPYLMHSTYKLSSEPS